MNTYASVKQAHIFTDIDKEWAMVAVDDPELDDLLIRNMVVDKQKRIYIGTDSGLYRYSNHSLTKLDQSFNLSGKSTNNPILNITILDGKYLAVNALLGEVVFFDLEKDGYVKAPSGFGFNSREQASKKASRFYEHLKHTISAFDLSEQSVSYTAKHKSSDGVLKLFTKTNVGEKSISTVYPEEIERIFALVVNENQHLSFHILGNEVLIYDVLNDTEHAKVALDIEPKIIDVLALPNRVFMLSDNELFEFDSHSLVARTPVSLCASHLSDLSHSRTKRSRGTLVTPLTDSQQSGNVILFSDCGLYRFNYFDKSLTPLIIPSNHKDEGWFRGHTYKQQYIVINTSEGAYFIEPSGKINRISAEPLIGDKGNAYAIAEISDEQYLLADGSPGLKLLYKPVQKFSGLNRQQIENLTGGQALRHVIKNVDGSIWLSSQTNGLVLARQQDGKWQAQAHYLQDIHVRSLHQYKDELWIATEDAGLHILNTTTNTLENILPELSNDSLFSFYPLNDGRLMIGGSYHTYVINQDLKMLEDRLDYFTLTWAIAQNENGDIWVADHVNGLYKLDSTLNEQEQYRYGIDLPKSVALDMTIDAYGQPIIATWGSGLYYRNKPGGDKPYNDANNEDAFKTLSTEDGLLSDTVQSIIKMNENTYWLSTEYGLSRVVLCQTTGCEHHITNFTEDDGLYTNLFDLNSANVNIDGSLIYGGFNGLNWFNPSQGLLDESASYIKHYIDTVYINGARSAVNINDSGERIELFYPHGTQDIKIRYTTNDYIAAKRKIYRYSINGNPWVRSDEPEIVLSGFSYGDFEIKANSSNHSGQWSDDVLQLRISIPPPIWWSPYAWIVYLVCLSSIVFFFLKRREQVHLQRERDLRARVYQQTREIQRRNVELEYAKETQARIFESASHELQTPLALIKHRLKRIPFDAVSAPFSASFSKLQKHVGVVEDLVQVILRREFDAIKMHSASPRNIVEELKELVAQRKSFAAQKNIRIEHNLDGLAPAFVLISTQDMHALFGNIIDNAIRYSPSDSTIMVQAILDLPNSADEYILRISDQGPGMQNLQKFGQRYYREHPEIEGFGVGLHNALDVVDRAAGTIAPENLPEGGLSITVRLPLYYTDSASTEHRDTLMSVHEEEAQHQPAKELNVVSDSAMTSAIQIGNISLGVADRKRSDKFVMIVEDDLELGQIIKEHLDDYFTTVLLENGELAKKHLLSASHDWPDLILSDLMMPKISGFELCNWLKQHSDLQHIPVILLTAKSDSSSQKHGLLLGADDYVSKLADLETVQLKITNLLATSFAQKQRTLLQNLNALEELKQETKTPAPLETHSDIFKAKVLAFINENATQRSFKLSDLEEHMHMSNSTLRRRIKAHFAMKFTDLLSLVRLRGAKSMINKGLSFGEIADALQFNDQSRFSSWFKQQTGKTPTEFKRENHL